MAKTKEIELPSDKPAEKAKTASAMIEVPVNVTNGFAPQAFNFRISRDEACKMRALRESLHTSGATYFDGKINRHIDRPHDVFRWLLAQLEVA